MKYKIFIISFLIIMIFISMFYASTVYSNQIKYVNQECIKNNNIKMITKDSIIDYLKLNKILKDSVKINEIDLNKIEKKLNEIGYIKNSNAHLNLDFDLEINIQERLPIVKLNYLNSYLDEFGELVPTSTIYKPNVISFFGKVDSLKHYKIGKFGNKIISDEFFRNHIRYILFDSDNLFLKVKNQDYLVEIGNFNSINRKLMNYKLFYAAKSSDVDLSKTSKINLRFNNQVITELK